MFLWSWPLFLPFFVWLLFSDGDVQAFAVFFHICTVIDVETNDLLNILNEGFTTIHIFTIENEIGFDLENND